jgi:hypothetical protein
MRGAVVRVFSPDALAWTGVRLTGAPVVPSLVAHH